MIIYSFWCDTKTVDVFFVFCETPDDDHDNNDDDGIDILTDKIDHVTCVCKKNSNLVDSDQLRIYSFQF